MGKTLGKSCEVLQSNIRYLICMPLKRKAQPIRKIVFSNILMGLFLGLWVPLRIDFLDKGWLVDFGVEAFFLFLMLYRYKTFDAIFVERREKDKKSPFRRYTSLILDILAAFPFVTLLRPFFPMAQIEFFFVFKIFFSRRVLDVNKILYNNDSLNPIVARLLPLGLLVPILVHNIACGWIWLGGGTAGVSGKFLDDYIKAIYWSITTLATVGYGDISAKTNGQMLYASATMIVGVAFFGYVLSSVASLLARLDHARENYLSTLDKVEDFMRYNDLPAGVRKKVRSYYHYIWERHHGYDDYEILIHLPQKLRAEVALSMNADIINKVPILKGISPELLQEIVLELNPIVTVPGQNVFHVGDPGDSMYFVHNGTVEIILPDGKIVAQLHPGAFFGEMALLNNNPRNATVRSMDCCDLFVLKKDAFDKVMSRHPEFEKHVREIASQREEKKSA